MTGVLATPKQAKPCRLQFGEVVFRSWHNCLYSFPRNLAPDFTHYLSERPKQDKNKTERYETKNVVRRANFFQRHVTPGAEKCGAVTHLHFPKAPKFTIRYPKKNQ